MTVGTGVNVGAPEKEGIAESEGLLLGIEEGGATVFDGLKLDMISFSSLPQNFESSSNTIFFLFSA